MRLNFFPAIVLSVLVTPLVLARGDGGFQAPLTISAGRPGPVTVHSGDFNNDGKVDLVVANGVYSNEATGSPSILVLFQNPANRTDWKPVSIRVGVSAVFVRGADMDKDGFDDIMVGDTQRTAFFVKSKGDQTFETPVAITQAQGARWIALGDWNNDGNLDFASANFRTSNLTAFLGDGTGKFTLTQTLPGSREHTLEAMDFDGDGFMDLMMGHGLPGITAFKGAGNGKFTQKGAVGNLGCIEYIAEVGRYKEGEYILTGDFNKDKKGDLAVTCIDDNVAYCGTSLGNGTYRRTLAVPLGPGTESSAIADFTNDGNADVAMVSNQGSSLWVHPGKGDGNFNPPLVFGPTGTNPCFLIAQDLDGDGFQDAVSAEQTSFSLTIFWGKGGERFMESGFNVTGFTSAKAMGVADVDRDGVPDLLFPRSDQPVVNVYLKPGLAPATRPGLTIATANKYSMLETVDLNGDEILDLVGADPVAGLALVALLDSTAKAQNQLALPAGVAPAAVKVGRVDEDQVLDLVVPCKGSNHVAIFLGQGGGAFAEARILPTQEKPKNAALSLIDGDAFTDLVVLSDNTAVVHYGKGLGDLEAPVILVQDLTKLYTNLAVGDVNFDSRPDVLLSESKTSSLYIFHGRGAREFEPPLVVKVNAAPIAVSLSDLNGDGLTDITTANSTTRSVSVLLNRNPGGLLPPVAYGLGLLPTGHRLVDLNLDGAPDVVAFTTTSAMILLGRSAVSTDGRFRRGDVNADGLIMLNDPIVILNRLFLGGEAIPCEDAADADDDGLLMLNDAITILGRLFLGGPPLPPPGPDSCGEDGGQDFLECQAACSA